jgi:hypothetical protein
VKRLRFCATGLLLLRVSLGGVVAQQSSKSTAPAKLRLCLNPAACANLTWMGDHYDGLGDNDTSASSRYTLVVWSKDRVELKGATVKLVDGVNLSEGDFHGKIAASGEHLDSATFEWHVGTKSSGTGSFALVWGKELELALTVPAGMPVSVDAFTFGGNSARYRVTSLSPVAVTAYAIQGAGPSGQAWSHVEDFRTAGADPLAIGQSHLGERIWNTFEYPRGLHVTAAIFADGTTRGDAEVIETILAKRKEEVHTYVAMSRAVCGMAEKGESARAIRTILSAKKSDYVRTYPEKKYVSSGGEEAYSVVTGGLAKAGSVDAVKATLTEVQARVAKLLLDPARDSSGKALMHEDNAAYSCNLN